MTDEQTKAVKQLRDAASELAITAIERMSDDLADCFFRNYLADQERIARVIEAIKAVERWIV